MNETLSPADGDKIPGFGILKNHSSCQKVETSSGYISAVKTALFSLNPNEDETVHKCIYAMSLTGKAVNYAFRIRTSNGTGKPNNPQDHQSPTCHTHRESPRLGVQAN